MEATVISLLEDTSMYCSPDETTELGVIASQVKWFKVQIWLQRNPPDLESDGLQPCCSKMIEDIDAVTEKNPLQKKW